MTRLPAAVLWDLDGTLVDTEPYWWRVEQELVESFGGSWSTAQGQALIGTGMDYSGSVLQDAGVALDVREISDRLSAQVLALLHESTPWRPGVPALPHALHAAGVPQAIVTMSQRPTAEFMAKALGPGVIEVVVSADDVTRYKPHPEPYHLAAQRLGVPIADCLAFEDSLPGTASAMASGAVTIGVTAHLPLPASAAHRVLPSLAAIGVPELAELFDRARGAA